MKFNYLSSWASSLLDDVTERGSGHTPSQSSPEYWNGEIKWVSLADSSKLDNIFISITDKRISELGIKNSSAVKHPAGTVILSRDAGVGKSAILKEEMAVSQHFIVWKCSSKNVLYNIYLYYWLQMMKPEFERMAVGSTIKTIGLPYFKKLKINYPPLREQCRIAEILGVWDESIDLLEKLIAAKRKLKQGLAQQLLTGKRRFEKFDDNRWKKYRLKEVFKRITRKNTSNSSNILTISGNHGLINQREIFNKRIAADNLDGYYFIKKGEFAYNKSYSNGYPLGAIKRLERYEEGVLSTLYICFGLSDSLADGDFMAHYFESGIFNKEIYGIAQEGARNHGLLNISVTDFFELLLHIPLLPEQEKIASVLSAADAEISTLEKQLAAYKQQKRGLMQQLLTGWIRVLGLEDEEDKEQK